MAGCENDVGPDCEDEKEDEAENVESDESGGVAGVRDGEASRLGVASFGVFGAPDLLTGTVDARSGLGMEEMRERRMEADVCGGGASGVRPERLKVDVVASHCSMRTAESVLL